MHHLLLDLIVRLKLALPVVHSQVHQVVVLDLIAVQLLLHPQDNRLLAGKPVKKTSLLLFSFLYPKNLSALVSPNFYPLIGTLAFPISYPLQKSLNSANLNFLFLTCGWEDVDDLAGQRG